MEDTPITGFAGEHNLEQGFPKVRPWIRYWARYLDIMLFSLLAGTILAFVSPTTLNISAFVLGFGVLFLWIFVESIMLSTIGTTPGKLLFNISLKHISSQKISFLMALNRSFYVWMVGLGLGIPIITVFTLIIEYKRLRRERITTWDRAGNFVVTHGIIGAKRSIAAILLIAGFFGLFVYDKYTKIGFGSHTTEGDFSGVSTKRDEFVWERYSIGTPSLSLETPVMLKPYTIDLDESTQASIKTSESYGYATDDFEVATSFVTYIMEGVRLDLAEMGSMESMKSTPGISDFRYTSESITNSGIPGRLSRGAFVYQDRKQLFRNVLFSDGTNLWQVAVSWPREDYDLELAANRIINSIRIDN